MLINVLWCISDTTICKATITWPICSFRQQINIGIWESSSPKTSSGKNQQKQQNGQQGTGVHCQQFQVQKQRMILPLYKYLVLPHLEYAVQFWCPQLRRDIDKIEKIQRSSTMMIPEIRNHSYHQLIHDIDLISLGQSRLRGQLIEVVKYLNEFTSQCKRALWLWH